ncbi:MAG: hypothetical protein ACJAUH_000903 [Saprospiraceae bacterium]|jgi:hypothetical protein
METKIKAMKTLITSTLTALITLLAVGYAFADGARNNLSVAPQKVYPKMIEAVKAQDWNKLNNALKILQPLSEEIDNTLRVNLTVELKQAIADRNSDLAEAKVLEFIVGGIRSLLILSGREDTPELRKEMFRQAFTEFVAIEPYLKKLNVMQTELIMENFRTSYNNIKDKSRFITNAMIINKQLRKVIEGKP